MEDALIVYSIFNDSRSITPIALITYLLLILFAVVRLSKLNYAPLRKIYVNTNYKEKFTYKNHRAHPNYLAHSP